MGLFVDKTPANGFDNYYVRILFGPMFGADILVCGREVFFCIGKNITSDTLDSDSLKHSLQQALNTLYIPHRDGSPNVRLRFTPAPSDYGDGEPSNASSTVDFEIDYLQGEGSETRNGRFNIVCRCGDIAFSVKRQADEWSEDVVAYTLQTEAAGATPSAQDNESHDAGNEPTSRGRWLFAAKLGAVVLLGAAATTLAWWQIQEHISQQKVASLSTLLAQAPGRNYVLPAGNGLCVFSSTQDGAQWDRQALLKAPQNDAVRVASLAEERARLEGLLDRQSIRFVTVRLDDPGHPVLVLPVDDAREETVQAEHVLASAAPYANTITVIHVALDTLDAQAQAVLATAGCPYRRAPRRDGATYQITGALSDESLASLQRLVSQFSHKWGTRSIDFRIQMRTNWLKGKTYQDGSGGYVLLDPASWYFPQPFTGAH